MQRFLLKIIIIILLAFPHHFLGAAELDLTDLALQEVNKTQSQIISGPQNTQWILGINFMEIVSYL